ncbi:MAG: FixH family protein [Myxococcales bacterium]|nr:FixH family protein [Myxococcales bacterium]
MSENDRPTKRPFNPWPWGIGLGLMVVFVANGIMLYIANREKPVIETTRYYEEGLEYDRVMEAQRASAALGWSAAVELVEDGVRYELRDRTGGAVTGLQGALAMRRADTTAYDVEAAFQEIAPGVYLGPRAKARGLYRLDARLDNDAGAPWVDQRKLYVP